MKIPIKESRNTSELAVKFINSLVYIQLIIVFYFKKEENSNSKKSVYLAITNSQNFSSKGKLVISVLQAVVIIAGGAQKIVPSEKRLT